MYHFHNNLVSGTIKLDKNANLKSPILLIIFDKPEKTYRVFQQIKKVRPEKLYISCDGPRNNVIGEVLRVRDARKVIEHIDWECDICTKFSLNNSGSAKSGVVSGINWFFENEEKGIILESECLPNISFFYFCDALLNYYRFDSRIMHISGNNYQKSRIDLNGSYYFSKIPFIWGWATWKRAWNHYDIKMKPYPVILKNKRLYDIFDNSAMKKYWSKRFHKVFENKIDTWDYQWLYSIIIQNGLCVTPNNNLVMNIGFDNDAIHTKIDSHGFNKYRAVDMEELVINEFVLPDKKADLCNMKTVLNPNIIKKVYIKYIELLNSAKGCIKDLWVGLG